MDFKEYEFRQQLEHIKQKEGRGTELISLYIPASKPLADVASYLRDEYGSAANIKSKQTRSNVQGAIDSILARLKFYKSAPENGLAIFCGALPIGGDRYQIESIVIEPSQPIQSFSYRCSSNFVLEPLEKMLNAKHVYGLIVVDWQESTVGLLNGAAVEAKDHLESMVPRKTRRGGQSAHRYQENHDICVNDHFKKTGESASRIFLAAGVEGILIGGAATKEDFVRGDYLHHELRKKVIGTFDVGYTNEYGLKELVERAGESLQGLEATKEKELGERFMLSLVNDKAAYGIASVRKNMEIGAVDILLISETFPDDVAVKELVEAAENTGATAEFISNDSEDGEKISKVFGGIVAILRYKTGV
jgi:peptide chain release factor 1, archaeal and eukaryotic forms